MSTNRTKSWNTVAIVGVGLIGGSIGLALRHRRLSQHVVGIGRRTSSLQKALRCGAVTRTTTNLAKGVEHAELVVVCTPVSAIAEHVRQVAGACPPETLITDAGSTKAHIVSEVEAQVPREVAFVGSHPLAGSEKTGPEAARQDLFQNRPVVVTPTRRTRERDVQATIHFWSALGADVVTLSPAAHDAAVAATSHVPHVVAALLAAATPEKYLSLVSTGWLDTTRIAGGDVALWMQILQDNRPNVLQGLDKFASELDAVRQALQDENERDLANILEKEDAIVTLWEVDIYPAPGQVDLEAQRITADAADMGVAVDLPVSAARGYLIQGRLEPDQVAQLSRQLLADPVVERTVVAPVGDERLCQPPGSGRRLVHVLPKPGVMDPVAQSALAAIADYQVPADAVRTLQKYWLGDISDGQLDLLCSKILANDSIEQVVIGPLTLDHLEMGAPYQLQRITVPLRQLDDAALVELSRSGQLYLTLVEMQTIQAHYRELGRDPTDAELETIAQTWSEHCSHKTLAGRIAYRDEKGERHFENMLKETIFAATMQIRQQLGADDWCVSVFEDNAGIVRFDDEQNVVFKVETHNHPSALEPYGGANTGIGGVIRDPLGTGLGAKPVCNTDVFCFAPPDLPVEQLPPGVLHPRRVMKGVVAGVRDYGNRMGIPTVNGAIYFDRRYLGNPLVYCGNVGILPRDKSHKQPQAGDHIVVIGGRTGRDGIHGATFSSAELTSDSDTLSGGAVQIGNAITEKMVLDVLLAARDRGLYSAVTDCGAGGFSSAVGEMGEKIGAEVWLDRAPLKYDGLSYTEIWISEAQERMVFSVPPEKWDEFSQLCASESVEATVIGRFVPTGRLQLKYHDTEVADLSMQFLHDGRPPIVRDATYEPPPIKPLTLPLPRLQESSPDFTPQLLKILGSLNVASKEWVVRQYDHEVQGGSVIKPLVGAQNDGPGDAAVVRPILDSRRGLVISCGMNPRFGDLDTYHMAASAIDEAVRNCVAVGADPQRIAILDNFCWGYTDRAETLGSLVRAALACYDVAVALGTPFISGKDSLNNEFSYQDASGQKQTISIPPSLLISALGQVDDIRQCVTMDLKEPGNYLYQVGLTKNELGGSHLTLVAGTDGGVVPQVDVELAKQTFQAVHQAIRHQLVRACHDLSEGGLAAAAAEMAFAGNLGATISVAPVPRQLNADEPAPAERDAVLMFAESNSRFLCEVPPQQAADFEQTLGDVPHARIGQVEQGTRLKIVSEEETPVVEAELAALKEAWQAPLRW